MHLPAPSWFWTVNRERLEAAFKAVGGRGALDWNAFRWGDKALDANDRILYDAAKGVLSYDADGSGAGAAVQFAKVSPWTWPSLDDFRII